MKNSTITTDRTQSARTLKMNLDNALDEISSAHIVNRGPVAKRIAKMEAQWDALPEYVKNAAREAGQTICGLTIQIDRSGQGHAWMDIDAQDIPASVREEIEGEIVGGNDDADDFTASNGQHYRW